MSALDCPGIDCLQGLLAATLPPDQRDRCERHLESCPICQERLDQAEDCDEVVRLAREVGDPTCSCDPTLAEVLERLHGARGQVTAEEVDLYFLGPTERTDILGTLGEYEVQEVIGQGGMGVVLKAYQPGLHRLVAIKVLAPSLAGSASARKRFWREVQAAAAVCHDHIVTVYGAAEENGLPYLVMQYVAGESLQARLDRSGLLELTEVVRIGMQAAQGLAAAHALGLIHRDIKPANLLLAGERGCVSAPRTPGADATGLATPGADATGLATPGADATGLAVKITDFGLARMVDDIGFTRNGVVVGTPEYMAPEQARGETVDHRADLFSLGCVLHVMCTAVQPFQGPTALAVLRAVSEQEPTPIRQLNPNVPAWLEDLITRLLAKDPAHRFQSATEVAALLEGYLAHLRQPASSPAPLLPPSLVNGERQPRPARWSRGPLWLTVGVVLLALGLGKGLMGQIAPPPGQTTREEFHHDFRGNKPLEPTFTLTGTNGEETIEAGEKGLRVTIPPTRVKKDAVGLELKTAIAGNFEVTLAYEILEIHRPRNPWGAGVELYIVTSTDTREAIAFASGQRPNGQDMYLCSRMTTRDGARVPGSEPRFVPLRGRSGQLRISREGEEARLSASEDTGEDFREVCRFPLGGEDLHKVRVAVFPGNLGAPLDVRLIDLRIGTKHPVGGPAASSAEAVPRGWLVTVELLGMGMIAALAGLGVFLYVRRRQRVVPAQATTYPEPAGPETPSESIPFSCPGCGKKGKVRGTLTGKKIKCPGCGQVVQSSTSRGIS